MLESFSFRKYKDLSSLKAVLRVCEMSSCSIKSTGRRWQSPHQSDQGGFSNQFGPSLNTTQERKKTTKQVQSKHHTAEGTYLMQSIREKLNTLEKN